MATNYPGSQQTFTNPNAADPLNSPSHSGNHTTAEDTLEAVQAAIGYTGAFEFADHHLSNLTATVAINTSLISDADSTDNLGSTSNYWANTYTDKLYLNSTAILSGASAGVVDITGTLAVDHIQEHTASHMISIDDNVGMGVAPSASYPLNVAGANDSQAAFIAYTATNTATLAPALGGYTSTTGVKSTTQTSGAITAGILYTMTDWITNDDFTNVGAASNADGVQFLGIQAAAAFSANNPTHWAHSSVLTVGRTVIGLQYGNWWGFNGTAIGEANLMHIGAEVAGSISFGPGAGGLTTGYSIGVKGSGFHNWMGGGYCEYATSTNSIGGWFSSITGNAGPNNLTITNSYGIYIASVANDADHLITNDYQLYVEAPANTASTNRYQTVLAGTSTGTGIWFSSGATTTPRIWASSATQGDLGINTTAVISWDSAKLGFYATTPVTKRAHIADATDAATAITRINAILLALEQYGLLATS